MIVYRWNPCLSKRLQWAILDQLMVPYLCTVKSSDQACARCRRLWCRGLSSQLHLRSVGNPSQLATNRSSLTRRGATSVYCQLIMSKQSWGMLWPVAYARQQMKTKQYLGPSHRSTQRKWFFSICGSTSFYNFFWIELTRRPISSFKIMLSCGS